MQKDWMDEIKDVKELNLDLQNPRLPLRIRERKDLTAVRNYLLDNENVLDIAKSIATNGYHRSAVAITCIEDGEIIVLDGNRRLAACQLLLNPSLAQKNTDQKKLKDWNLILDKSQLSKIKITVAPSRKDAEREIWDIHVNRLLKSWEQLQRIRMYRRKFKYRFTVL